MTNDVFLWFFGQSNFLSLSLFPFSLSRALSLFLLLSLTIQKSQQRAQLSRIDCCSSFASKSEREREIGQFGSQAGVEETPDAKTDSVFCGGS
jgi:hypothetical protein